MKEGFTELLKELKERFRSPFFSAFIIAWCIHNWKVPIVLLWYNAKDFENFKDENGKIYYSYIDFISNYLTFSHGVLIPLVYATLYAFFIAPFFRYAFTWLNTLVNKYSSRAIKSKSTGGFVTVENYIAQEEEYNRKGKLLEEKIAIYENIITENNKLKSDIIEKDNIVINSNNKTNELESENFRINQQLNKLQKDHADLINEFEEAKISFKAITGNYTILNRISKNNSLLKILKSKKEEINFSNLTLNKIEISNGILKLDILNTYLEFTIIEYYFDIISKRHLLIFLSGEEKHFAIISKAYSESIFEDGPASIVFNNEVSYEALKNKYS